MEMCACEQMYRDIIINFHMIYCLKLRNKRYHSDAASLNSFDENATNKLGRTSVTLLQNIYHDFCRYELEMSFIEWRQSKDNR